MSRTHALFHMDGAIRSAVHALKYEGVRAIAPVLAAQMAAMPAVRRVGYDLIVPVPLHPRRLRDRGYNQSELLADHIGQALRVPVHPRALRRISNTPRQVEAADEQQRERQVAGAFAPGPDMARQRALLVDDVCTTGSTLAACAAALLDGGAGRVDALVLAKEV